jgi:hypothetical protein
MAIVIDSLSFAILSNAATVTTFSATILVDPQDIFVAQVALTQMNLIGGEGSCHAFISGIALTDGNSIDFSNGPPVFEWFDATSVTFVLVTKPHLTATALATVTSYNFT